MGLVDENVDDYAQFINSLFKITCYNKLEIQFENILNN